MENHNRLLNILLRVIVNISLESIKLEKEFILSRLLYLLGEEGKLSSFLQNTQEGQQGTCPVDMNQGFSNEVTLAHQPYIKIEEEPPEEPQTEGTTPKNALPLSKRTKTIRKTKKKTRKRLGKNSGKTTNVAKNHFTNANRNINEIIDKLCPKNEKLKKQVLQIVEVYKSEICSYALENVMDLWSAKFRHDESLYEKLFKADSIAKVKNLFYDIEENAFAIYLKGVKAYFKRFVIPRAFHSKVTVARNLMVGSAQHYLKGLRSGSKFIMNSILLSKPRKPAVLLRQGDQK